MAAVGSAGGSAMMMWVATHNAKAQQEANESVDKARDMLDLERQVTKFRQKLNEGNSGDPMKMKELSDEINAYIEANKDSPLYEDVKEQLQPMADSLAFEAAKHFVAQLANNSYMTQADLDQAREFVKNPKFRQEYPDITDAIENGHLDYSEASDEARRVGRGELITPSGDDWYGIDVNQHDGKDDDGADGFDRGDGLQKELSHLQRSTEDFANMASKERELLMSEAGEKRDVARQVNEQGAKLIASQEKSSQDIINTVYRA
jgi:hypothetical protein